MSGLPEDTRECSAEHCHVVGVTEAVVLRQEGEIAA